MFIIDDIVPTIESLFIPPPDIKMTQVEVLGSFTGWTPQLRKKLWTIKLDYLSDEDYVIDEKKVAYVSGARLEKAGLAPGVVSVMYRDVGVGDDGELTSSTYNSATAIIDPHNEYVVYGYHFPAELVDKLARYSKRRILPNEKQIEKNMAAVTRDLANPANLEYDSNQVLYYKTKVPSITYARDLDKVRMIETLKQRFPTAEVTFNSNPGAKFIDFRVPYESFMIRLNELAVLNYQVNGDSKYNENR